MAYGVAHFFPGGTEEQYEASIRVVHPSRVLDPRSRPGGACTRAP